MITDCPVPSDIGMVRVLLGNVDCGVGREVSVGIIFKIDERVIPHAICPFHGAYCDRYSARVLKHAEVGEAPRGSTILAAGRRTCTQPGSAAENACRAGVAVPP